MRSTAEKVSVSQPTNWPNTKQCFPIVQKYVASLITIYIYMLSFSISVARYCPYAHPFAVNNGTHCCSFSNKRNNTDIGCNGNGTVQFSDPKECCKREDWIECPNKVGGCKTHALSDRKLTNLEWVTNFSVAMNSRCHI